MLFVTKPSSCMESPPNCQFFPMLKQKFWNFSTSTSFFINFFPTKRFEAVELFLGLELCEVPLWWRFIPQNSWHLPNFQTCEAKCPKPIVDMDPHDFAKIWARSSATFLSKIFLKKRLHEFLKKFIEKKNDFRVFFIFDRLYLPTETEYRIHGIVNCTSVP